MDPTCWSDQRVPSVLQNFGTMFEQLGLFRVDYINSNKIPQPLLRSNQC